MILVIYTSQAKCGVCYPDCYALWFIPQQTVAMVEMNTEYIYYVEPIMNSTLEWLDEWHVA